MLRRALDQRQKAARTEVFPAPARGWVQSGNIVLAGKDQAEVLDNFIPTAQGARLRGGMTEYADLGAPCVRLFTYASGTQSKLFGATAANIFDASNVGAGAVRSGTTSGDWSAVQMATPGGEFLVGVNGADTGWTYNGTAFSDISITGVASSALSQAWTFKERVFFVEKNTMNAWYLPVESIGGTATKLSLGAVFGRGGALLFGAAWSLDSGAGLDDVCVFVSDQGEIAVYEGTDPASATTWGRVGVYDIAPPLNKHAWFKAGGDLAILTGDGIVPVSEALRRDRAALQAVAITSPIEDAWKDAIANATTSYPVSATLWQSHALLLVGTPAKVGGLNVSFVANARTGAWARITGWDVRSAAVSADVLYFGTNAGKVMIADSGGNDNGAEYTASYVSKFSGGDRLRDAVAAGLTYKCPDTATFRLYAHSDYVVSDMSSTTPAAVYTGAVWGTGVWGTFVWGSAEATKSFTEWQTVRAGGYALAPGLVISSNQVAKVSFEIMATRLLYEAGRGL